MLEQTKREKGIGKKETKGVGNEKENIEKEWKLVMTCDVVTSHVN